MVIPDVPDGEWEIVAQADNFRKVNICFYIVCNQLISFQVLDRDQGTYASRCITILHTVKKRVH